MVVKKQLLSDIGSIISMPMPEGAKILNIQVQPGSHGAPSMWYLCDPSKPEVRRVFRTVKTGETGVVEDGWDYVGTFSSISGVNAWHVFEVK